MLSFKFLKIFLLFALFAPACRFWQSKADAPDAPPTPPAVEKTKSDVPFATKEPEVFQTEIVVTANGVEDVMFAARNGASRLTVYDYGKKSEFALLQTGGNTSFLIARSQKIYAENQTADGLETAEDYPNVGLFDQIQTAAFESLGAENGLIKYRVVSDVSETIITVDENIKLPVRQEFYSVSGASKTLVSTAELKNFRWQTDAQNFELPKNYKKVTAGELHEILRRERTK